MLLIRSWSGGRILEEHDHFLSSSFDWEGSDEGDENSIQIVDERLDEISKSSSEYYDDDFTDIENSQEDEESISFDVMDNENKNLCKAMIKDVQRCAVSDNNEHGDMTQTRPFDDSKSFDIHPSIDVGESKYDASTSNSYSQTSGCGLVNDSNNELNFLEANTRHKRWLLDIQHAAKLKKQINKEAILRMKEKKVKRREMLVLKARNRKRVGYDYITEAAKFGRVEKLKHKEQLSEDVVNENEKIQEYRVRRQHHKLKYREHLASLVKRRKFKKSQEEMARIQAETTKRNVTAIVLNDIKKKKDETEKTDVNVLIESEGIKNGVLDRERKEIRETKDNVKNCNFKKRYTMNLISIVTERQRKTKEAEKLKRRLDKRAAILRNQYEQKVTNVKIWKRGLRLQTNRTEKEKSTEKIMEQINDGQFDSGLLTKNEVTTKLTLTPSQVEALALRLYKKNQKNDKEVVRAKNGQDNFDSWKYRNGLESTQKVFCMTGWYPSIRDELLSRGWFLNQDRESRYFDLKFTLAVSDIDFDSLNNDQMVNHFKNSTCLTTKVGLVQTLRNSPFLANYHTDMNDFFPRSYDLSYQIDVQSFLDDYSCLCAVASLKRLLETYQLERGVKINIGVFKSLVHVIEKFNYSVNDSFIDSSGVVEEQCFTSFQSKIIQNADEWLYQVISREDIEHLDCPVNEMKCLLFEKKERMNEDDRKHQRKRKKLIKAMSRLVELDDQHVNLVKTLLEKYCGSESPQNNINGIHSDNIWILKPAGKSRGRGITVVQTLTGILEHIHNESDSRNRLNQWVIQKYIENPLTISRRKFDIRQWVMVTDWNPVTIWFYNECYIRFAVLEYESSENMSFTRTSVKKDDWASNKYRHLVNNSIVKKSDDFSKCFIVEEIDDVVKGYMWPLEKFKQWLIQKTGRNEWEVSLSKKIKEIVIDTILCSQEKMITERKRSWETYGFDIMIDDNYHPWLIEVNSSPACDYSTTVTERFVKKALPDTLKVILDGIDEVQKYPTDTGGWECIYCGDIIPKVAVGFGTDMPLKGEKMSIKRNMKTIPKKTNWQYGSRTEDDLVFDDSDLSDYEQKKASQKSDSKPFHQYHHELNKENQLRKNGNIASYQNHLQKRRTKMNVNKTIVPLNRITLGL